MKGKEIRKPEKVKKRMLKKHSPGNVSLHPEWYMNIMKP